MSTLYSDQRKKGNAKLRHPVDARQRKKFDERYYLEIKKDPRNFRLVLSTNGMNLFVERTSTHNTWPVILTMYNLPIWLSQKRKYLQLSILIQGPKHPGIDIDIFLEPLMQEMETLWKEGINIVDGFMQQPFNLRAIIFITIHDYKCSLRVIIFITIHDYQALAILSRQIKGKTSMLGCPACLDGTVWSFLEGSRKIVYHGYMLLCGRIWAPI